MTYVILLLLSIGCKTSSPTSPSTAPVSPAPASTAPVSPAPASPAPATLEGALQQVQESGYHGVIIPASHEQHMGMQEASGGAISGYWTPDVDSIRAFERGLLAFMASSPHSNSPQLHEKASDYKRQYIGFLSEERKLIYGNFLCAPKEGWTEHAVQVEDGGDCYFQIVFDVEAGTYSDFYVNGSG